MGFHCDRERLVRWIAINGAACIRRGRIRGGEGGLNHDGGCQNALESIVARASKSLRPLLGRSTHSAESRTTCRSAPSAKWEGHPSTVVSRFEKGHTSKLSGRPPNVGLP